MLDTVRRYVEAGREALTPRKAEEMARALSKEGQARRDQVTSVARELVEWSRKNSERLLATIRAEVKRQLARTGVATKDDIESLKQRIRKLEAGGGSTRSTRATRAASGGSTRAPRSATSRKTAATRKRAAPTRRPG
jgi:polyhydroxyalkanoate synthesis regulator phasin